ncbi:MAG TPA: ABC transporter permease [Candidatus Polarisedimenticolia bacterium]|nr:ABC transporter permease [Candidatus Polarisedimenticolia bacterium]
MRHFVVATAGLVRREIVRFLRERTRVFGALVQPILFWAMFGAGLRSSFRPPVGSGEVGYAEYLFPGTVVLILLFTAIFSTISLIEDRREGFLQGVLVAPIPRSGVVFGKIFGGTILALLQGMLVLACGPLVGVRLSARTVGLSLAILASLALALTALSFCIAWRMESTQGFHAIMTVFLMPLWLLSGAFFPAAGGPAWLGRVMSCNPLTYGVAAFRHALYPADAALRQGIPPAALSVGVTLLFGAAAIIAALLLACHRPSGAGT